jgi:hypothetical protein
MSIWAYKQMNWRLPEWRAFSLVFGLLMLPALLNGFPFLFPDSWGYSGACPDELRSPVIGCAMRPFTWAGGNWAYAIVQSAATAAAIVLLWSRVLKRRGILAVLTSVIAAGVGLFSGWVMADAWTLVGFICLFAIGAGYFHPLAAGALAFACGAHFGNFPILGATALALLPIVRAKKTYAVQVALCLAAAAGLVVGANLFGGSIKFGSGNGTVFLASRILHDMPEVLVRKCRQDPGFAMCPRRDEVLSWSAENHQSFTWTAYYNLGLAWPELNRISRELVLFSLRGAPESIYAHAAGAARNTLRLLLFPELSNGFETFGPDSFVAQDLRIAFPADVAPYLRSLQATGALDPFLKKLDAPFIAVVWLSLCGCLLFVVTGWRRLREDMILQLALFALMVAVVNALFMSNLSGVFGRYQARIAFLPILAVLMLAARWAHTDDTDAKLPSGE